MANYRTSRIIPFVLVIVVIIIAIASLVSLARAVFFSGSTAKTTSSDTSQVSLLDTTVGHSVLMTVRGPIVADEKFHSYKIAISSDTRTIKTYTGYLDSIVDQNSLGNNVASYDQFVHALDKANLTKGKQLEGDKNSTLGICATGSLYDFSIMNNDNVVKNLWTSTCNGSPGSLSASVTQLTSLFTNQIPGANTQISKIGL